MTPASGASHPPATAMNPNDFSGDPFTRPLDPAMLATCADARALVELLSVDSYTQMGRVEGDQRGQLAQIETRLERGLAKTLAGEKATPWTPADHGAAYAFAQAFRLLALYPDTVSGDGEMVATLAVPTFASVRPPHPDAARHAAAFRRLCERTGLTDGDRMEIEHEAQEAQRKVMRRKRLLASLRAELQPDPARPPGRDDAHRLFGVMFPEHPLLPGEVEVVLTESCVYFCILSNEAFAGTDTFLARDEAARAVVVDYLKRLRQFCFYNFSHFPAFTSFDAHEMEPAVIEQLARAMDSERSDLIALLNTAVFIEERDRLEKYLVHDSWGHFWQADLTQLGTLYDRMASLQMPLSPSDTVRIGDKLLSFLDLVYLRRDGSLVFDETLARRYAEAWTHERLQPLLAPVVAELAADMIEYRVRQECRAVGLELPSSSLFAHHPAKIDFAWADLSFFVKSLKRVNTLYQKDEELKAGFVERARLLFRLKYRRNYPAVVSAKALEAELRQILERLLGLFHEVQDDFLGIGLNVKTDAEGKPEVNAFFRTFLNLLQINVTLNEIVHGQMEGARPELAPHLQTLIMFIVKYFEREPEQGFWTLGETLATLAVPLLETLAECELSVNNPS